MIDLYNMRETIAQGLKAYLGGVPVIRGNQIQEQPKYPYVTYNATTIAGKNGGTYQQHEDGIDRKLVQSIWSITVLSKDWDEGVKLATKAREWFEHSGRVWLADRKITVQGTTDINNRDNILSGEYERKNGFDVFFYVYDEVTSPLFSGEYIEHVDVAHNLTR